MKLTRRTMLALPAALAARHCLAAPAPLARPRLPITRDNVAASSRCNSSVPDRRITSLTG